MSPFIGSTAELQRRQDEQAAADCHVEEQKVACVSADESLGDVSKLRQNWGWTKDEVSLSTLSGLCLVP